MILILFLKCNAQNCAFECVHVVSIMCTTSPSSISLCFCNLPYFFLGTARLKVSGKIMLVYRMMCGKISPRFQLILKEHSIPVTIFLSWVGFGCLASPLYSSDPRLCLYPFFLFYYRDPVQFPRLASIGLIPSRVFFTHSDSLVTKKKSNISKWAENIMFDCSHKK